MQGAATSQPRAPGIVLGSPCRGARSEPEKKRTKRSPHKNGPTDAPKETITTNLGEASPFCDHWLETMVSNVFVPVGLPDHHLHGLSSQHCLPLTHTAPADTAVGEAAVCLNHRVPGKDTVPR